jgi:hypothetical protein
LQPWEFAVFRTVRVHIDHHVEVDGHRYSVPQALVSQVIEARISAGVVELLHRGQRVAAHARSAHKGGFTTVVEHLPAAHRAHLQWLPWREAETPLIVSLRDTFEAAASEAGVPVERDRCRSLSKYLADGKYLMHYTCLVAETSRPALRAALVKRGFEPEANLNGRLFGLRRGSQTASLYCRFGEKFCELRFEHVPTH